MGFCYKIKIGKLNIYKKFLKYIIVDFFEIGKFYILVYVVEIIF